MTFIQSVKTCFRKYFVFKGRATRSEFWWFQLFSLIVLIVAAVIDSLLGYDFFEDNSPFTTAIEILVLVPSLSVTARRLHDLGISGWLQAPMVILYFDYLTFIRPGLGENAVYDNFILVAGLYWFVILIICIKRGKAGANKYGPDPLAPDMAEVFN